MTGNGDMTENVNTDEVWGETGRIEGGAQYVSNIGFTTELGLAMMVYNHTDAMTGVSSVKESVWPVFHFGWLW